MTAHQRKLAAVYLLRQKNDSAYLRNFITSYREMAEPLEHDLVIVFKGFSETNKQSCLDILEGVDHVAIDCEDRGFDIGSYLEVARETSYKRMLFLNSFSVLLASGWLSKLNTALDSGENIGVVGTTGSYEPSGADSPFPNYHIRTTGFFMDRQLLLDLDLWEMKKKHHTSRFEAGPDNLTQQILRREQTPIVVDRDGAVYGKEDWPHSGTYRTGDQELLLIADNRTSAYLEAEPEMRQWLHDLAWSADRPGPSPLKQRKWSRRLRRWFGLSGP